MLTQRRDHCVEIVFDALFSNGSQEGTGRLVDFSNSGAQLAEVSLLPEVGTMVRVYVFVKPVAPFELVGEVVRHSSGEGFAVEFKDMSPQSRALADDAAAIVDSDR